VFWNLILNCFELHRQHIIDLVLCSLGIMPMCLYLQATVICSSKKVQKKNLTIFRAKFCKLFCRWFWSSFYYCTPCFACPQTHVQTVFFFCSVASDLCMLATLAHIYMIKQICCLTTWFQHKRNLKAQIKDVVPNIMW